MRTCKRWMLCLIGCMGMGLLHAQEVPKIRIDPSQAYGGGASQYFVSVDYIPLESSKESMFGEARNIIITESSIVVYDYDTREALSFL